MQAGSGSDMEESFALIPLKAENISTLHLHSTVPTRAPTLYEHRRRTGAKKQHIGETLSNEFNISLRALIGTS